MKRKTFGQQANTPSPEDSSGHLTVVGVEEESFDSDVALENMSKLISGDDFKPDSREHEKLESKTAKQKEKIHEKNTFSTLNTVHALGLLAPGIVSAMSYGGSEAEQSERFIKWTNAIRKKASIWVEQLDCPEDEKEWVLSCCERILAEHPHLNDIQDLSIFKDRLREFIAPPEYGWQSLRTAVSLSILEAVGRVQRSQDKYKLFRKNPEQDLMKSAEVLLEMAQEGLLELSEKTASEEMRKLIYTTLLKTFSESMAQLWCSYGSNPQNNPKFRTEQDKELWHQKYPDGISLDPLFDQCRTAAVRIVRLSKMARYASL